MAYETVFCCFNADNGVTFLGFAELNIGLLWLASLSVFEMYYWPFDAMMTLWYGIRTYYFFTMIADANATTKTDYYDWYLQTTYAILGTYALIILLKWYEWSHIPTWTVVVSVLIGLWCRYFIGVLKWYKDNRRRRRRTKFEKLFVSEVEDSDSNSEASASDSDNDEKVELSAAPITVIQIQ